MWSQLNHCVVVLTVDVGLPPGLDEIAPGEVTLLGPFEALQTWSELQAGVAA